MKGSQAVARIIFQQRYEKSTKEREAKKFSKLLASIITDEDDESASHTTPLSNIRVATSTLHRKYWTCWITKWCASDGTDPWVLKILKGLLIVNSIAGNIEESKWKNNIAEPTHIWGKKSMSFCKGKYCLITGRNSEWHGSIWVNEDPVDLCFQNKASQ